MRSHRLRTAGSIAAAGLVLLLGTGTAAAHVVEHAGPYTLEIGWQHEPTYVDGSNGIQVIVTRDSKPVNDLAADDLKVVVTTGSQQSGELTFDPGFDPIELDGPLGEYDAPIVPTAVGDYSFHLTGSIHGQAVDITVASGAETFDTVKGTSDLQFPDKLPTLPELVTRLDRIDARTTSSAPPAGPSQASVDAVAAQASSAQAAADRALIVGGGIAVVGLLVGAAGVILALRATRRAGS